VSPHRSGYCLALCRQPCSWPGLSVSALLSASRSLSDYHRSNSTARPRRSSLHRFPTLHIYVEGSHQQVSDNSLDTAGLHNLGMD
jgi:hypothetical protein